MSAFSEFVEMHSRATQDLLQKLQTLIDFLLLVNFHIVRKTLVKKVEKRHKCVAKRKCREKVIGKKTAKRFSFGG